MKKIFEKTTSPKPRTIYIDVLKSKKQGTLIPYLLQLALMSVALSGLLYCVSTSVNMSVGYFTLLIMSVFSLAFVSLFTFSLKAYIPFISVFVCSSVFVFAFMRDLVSHVLKAFEFYYNSVIQIVVDEGYTNYKSSMTEDIAEKLADPALVQSYHNCVIAVLLIFFSVLFASALIRRSMIWLCIIPCFIVLTPSLYFGAVPDGIAFAVFVSGMIGCYVQNISYSVYKKSKKNKNISEEKKNPLKRIGNAYNTAASGLFSSIAVLAMSVCISTAVYSSEVLQIDSIREFIDGVANDILNMLFYEQFETPEGAIGGLIEGEILGLETPEFRNLPVMTVTSKTGSSLYLRGWIGTDLTDDGWNVINEEDDKEYREKVGATFNQYTQFYDYTDIVYSSELEQAETAEETVKLGFIYDTVTVKAKFKKSLMLFLPIAGINEEIDGKYRGVTMLGDTVGFFEGERPRNNKYSVDAAVQSLSSREFYLNFKSKQDEYLLLTDLLGNKAYNLNDEEMFMKGERNYAEYVKAKYLTVPVGTDFLDATIEEIVKNYATDFDKALAIERYFKTNYTYAENFTTVNGNAVDKVEYMISESKTGYCTYYATAMTVMLRRIGIPTRYVVGYHAKVSEETGKRTYTRELYDDNYHAWVEVYFDGIGWITFDPTPGSGTNALLRDYDYLDDPAPSDNSGNAEGAEPTEPTPPTAAPPEVEEEPFNDIGSEMPASPLIPTWLKVLLICIAVTAFIVISVLLTVLSIVQKFNSYYNKLAHLEPTVLVSTVYPDILRLLSSLGFVPRPGESLHGFANRIDKKFRFDIKLSSIIDTLEMTQFSNNKVDRKAASAVYDYFTKLSNTVFYSLNIFKRYYYMATIKKRSDKNEKFYN